MKHPLLRRILIGASIWVGIGLIILVICVAYTVHHEIPPPKATFLTESQNVPFGYPITRGVHNNLSTTGSSVGYSAIRQRPLWATYTAMPQTGQRELDTPEPIPSSSLPQNAGPLWEHWKRCINTHYSAKYGPIWVTCGPIFASPETNTPSAFYLILLRLEHSTPEIMAVVLTDPDRPGDRPVTKPCSVAALERATGIRFFPALNQDSDLIRRPQPVWD